MIDFTLPPAQVIEQIKKLKEAATKGPWWEEAGGFGGYFINPPVTPGGDDKLVGSIRKNEDAAFISSMPTICDYLMRMVEQYKYQIEKMARPGATFVVEDASKGITLEDIEKEVQSRMEAVTYKFVSKHLASIIRSKVGFFNGWLVSKETEEEVCMAAAEKIIKYLRRRKLLSLEPTEKK